VWLNKSHGVKNGFVGVMAYPSFFLRRKKGKNSLDEFGREKISHNSEKATAMLFF
jgi:hypothetical protein